MMQRQNRVYGADGAVHGTIRTVHTILICPKHLSFQEEIGEI